ncbi:MAG: hypothetical protein ACKOXB_05935 [Flavobacteriales bacterium]
MRHLIFAIAAFITLFSCTEKKCSGVIVHEVKITDFLGEAVVLDKYYTLFPDNGDTIKINRYRKDSLQYYPILDDNYSGYFKNQSTASFIFVGIKDGDTITSPYVFKYDGCHTSLESGTNKIVY